MLHRPAKHTQLVAKHRVLNLQPRHRGTPNDQPRSRRNTKLTAKAA